MKRLRILLQSNIFYIMLIFVSIIYSYIYINYFKHISLYDDINNEKFIVDKYLISDYGYTVYLRGKEIVIGYIDTISFEIGDEVLISGDEVDIKKPTLENNFDYKEYLYHNNIFKVIKISDIKIVNSNKSFIYKIKLFINNRCNSIKNSGNFINYLLFNNSTLEDDLYFKSGISHLFSISGLHIDILIIIIKKILFFVDDNIRDMFIIIVLILYLYIVSFPVSLFRTFLFFVIGFLFKVFHIKNHVISKIILAFFIMIMINPFYIYNIGFQFSFILCFFISFFKPKGNFISKIFKTCFISFIVSFPIIVYHNYEINAISFINNLFLVPLMSFIILPFSIITFIFPFFDSLLFLFINIQNCFLNFTLSNMSFNFIFCKVNVIYIFFIYTFIFFKFIRKKRIYIAILILLIFLWYMNFFISYDNIVYVDVDEGNSTIIHVNNTTTIIDTGGFYMSDDSKYTYKYSKRLINYLKSKGIRKIDNLVLTHGDRDHIKESSYLIGNYNVLNVYMNSNKLSDLEKKVISSCENLKTNYKFLNEGDYIILGDYKLFNLNTNYVDENDSSLFLYFNYNGKKFIFPGDATSMVENKIISKYNISDTEVLLLAHHGSKTSSSYDFLKNANPKVAIISSGKNNIYHHPSDATIDNLNKLNIKFLNTSVVSTIYYDLKNGYYFYNS